MFLTPALPQRVLLQANPSNKRTNYFSLAGHLRRLSMAQATSQTEGDSCRQQPAKRPIILFDIMDTVVKDPFYSHMPLFFGISFKELLALKHPTAWLEFERGELTEDEFYGKFFKDGQPCDGPGLRQYMVSHYSYIDGMEDVLRQLKQAGYEIHAMSNYPLWYRYIEGKLKLSEYLHWTYMSCEGPMKGYRKPQAECFECAASTLGTAAQDLLLIDDRQPNIDAALNFGMQAIHFSGTNNLIEQLRSRGLLNLQPLS